MNRVHSPAAHTHRATDDAVLVQTGMWRCFHCDEVFTAWHCARDHFGHEDGATPACQIKGGEIGLVEALRRAERDASDAWFALQNESSTTAKAFRAMQGRHQRQLTVMEQLGYERGLRDAQAHPETLGLCRTTNAAHSDLAGDEGDSRSEHMTPTELKRLAEENAALVAESAELTKALTGLTCGGSEFFTRKGGRYVADVKACVDYVKRTKMDAHQRWLSEEKQRRQLIEENERMREALERAKNDPYFDQLDAESQYAVEQALKALRSQQKDAEA